MVTVPRLGGTTKKKPRRKELADMPRQRKQSGYIYQRAGWWILRYREDVYQSGQLVRKQLAKQLQAVAPEHHRLKRPPASVAKLAESFLAPLNNQSTTSDSTRSLAGFVGAFYLPHVKEHMRASTYNGYRSVWVSSRAAMWPDAPARLPHTRWRTTAADHCPAGEASQGNFEANQIAALSRLQASSPAGFHRHPESHARRFHSKRLRAQPTNRGVHP
jgi:hypothetical protein